MSTAGARLQELPSRFWASVSDAIDTWSESATVVITARADTITVTATGPDAKLTVTRPAKWDSPAPDAAAALSTRHLRGKLRLHPADGWSTGGELMLTPARQAAAAKTPTRTTPVPADGFAHQLAAFSSAPDASAVQLGVTTTDCVVAAYSPVFTALASTADDPAVAAAKVAETVTLPPQIAAALAKIVTAEERANIDLAVWRHRNQLHLSVVSPSQVATWTIPDTPQRPWPQKPVLPTRPHDLIVNSLAQWREQPANRAAMTGPTYPAVHLRLDGEPASQVLRVYSKLLGVTVELALPAATSDRFELDLSWPGWTTLLAPAGDTVTLRYFDPNPTLTYLTATYSHAGFRGFSTVAATRPDRRLQKLD
ncbi:hypothetical protein ACFQNE_03080 [Gordonia phosphorivorans]|uniref:Uncharacterized protein n=1 Tax=Gordonia phosphorivorans TaxID=1056982 RepID=A0ABV6H4T6_9ACTN